MLRVNQSSKSDINQLTLHKKQMKSTNPKKNNQLDKEIVNDMIENAIRRHNRRSTIISAILGWILIGGYSFGLFHVVQNI